MHLSQGGSRPGFGKSSHSVGALLMTNGVNGVSNG